jgi:hypothetical protein
MSAMVWDAVGDRALVADSERHALLALRGSAGRLAYLVSGGDHTLIRLDLAAGSHTTVSGNAVGQGPKIMPGFARIAGEFARDIVYVKSNEDTILAVDLLNGERVILAR